MKNTRKIFAFFMLPLLLAACKDSIGTIEKKEITLVNKIDRLKMTEEFSKIKEKYDNILDKHSLFDFEILDKTEIINITKEIYNGGGVKEETDTATSLKTIQYDKDKRIIKNTTVYEGLMNSNNKTKVSKLKYEQVIQCEFNTVYLIDLMKEKYDKIGGFDSLLHKYAHYIGYIESFNPNAEYLSDYEYYFDDGILSLVNTIITKENDKLVSFFESITQMVVYDKSIECHILSNSTKHEYNEHYTIEINKYEYRILSFTIKNIKLNKVSLSNFTEDSISILIPN